MPPSPPPADVVSASCNLPRSRTEARSWALRRGGSDRLPGASRSYAVTKRLLDLIVAGALLVAAAPFMAVIAVLIKLDSAGPAVFCHSRLGRGGRPFRCLKFRTMRLDAQRRLRADPALWRRYLENDFKIPAEEDPRITRLGRFLRRSSLDELPQLFNVLAGSMSLVGPRPIVPEELAWYDGRAGLFLSVKPGITGHWQVQGRSRVGYPERVEVELEAIRRRSIRRDLVVLLKTAPAIIRARGAF